MKYREHRYPCGRPVTLRRGDTSASGVVVNVSQHGARVLLGDDLLPRLSRGDTVRLDAGAGNLPCDARIRWIRGHHAGLRFAGPLDSRMIAAIRKATVSRNVSRNAARKGTWNLQLRELR